ncbi:MAG: intradiol ring-cleavage dioxygenase [Acidimicrobiia bacterium]
MSPTGKSAMQRHDDYETEIFDRGLAFDLSTLMERRTLLRLAGITGLLAIAGCASDVVPASTTSTGAGVTSAAAGGVVCDVIPEETAGPFPGDGSNGPDVLAESGIVRSDITSSFGSSTTVAAGVPLTLKLRILDNAAGCAPLAGAAVYAWHCDREGRYSMYSDGVTNENYLRGVQEADADDTVTFTSIFPACYPGRWPHAHFEVYASLADATGGADPIATSQLAFPEDVSNEVYATAGYEQSVANLAELSLESDMVFADGADRQLGVMGGTIAGGLTVDLAVPV